MTITEIYADIKERCENNDSMWITEEELFILSSDYYAEEAAED